MTKQEEVFYILQDVRLGELTEYEATVKLQELGVMIINAKTGFVEPLIKEVKS